MNLPNKLSLLRIIFVPIIMLIYLTNFIPAKELVVTVIFLFAIFTDFLDGYIARKYNLVTDLGKFLDPIADKLLVTISLLLLVVDKTIISPFGVIVIFILLTRDFIVGTLRQMVALKGTALSADKLGKFKTLITDIAIALLFIVSYNNTNNAILGTGKLILNITSFSLLFVAMLLTIISGINYITKNKKVFLK